MIKMPRILKLYPFKDVFGINHCVHYSNDRYGLLSKNCCWKLDITLSEKILIGKVNFLLLYFYHSFKRIVPIVLVINICRLWQFINIKNSVCEIIHIEIYNLRPTWIKVKTDIFKDLRTKGVDFSKRKNN